jgi:hypothetical protein
MEIKVRVIDWLTEYRAFCYGIELGLLQVANEGTIEFMEIKPSLIDTPMLPKRAGTTIYRQCARSS